MTPEQAQRIELCDREIERCIQCQREATTDQQRFGAGMGWVDWMAERQRLLEEVARLR